MAAWEAWDIMEQHINLLYYLSDLLCTCLYCMYILYNKLNVRQGIKKEERRKKKSNIIPFVYSIFPIAADVHWCSYTCANTIEFNLRIPMLFHKYNFLWLLCSSYPHIWNFCLLLPMLLPCYHHHHPVRASHKRTRRRNFLTSSFHIHKNTPSITWQTHNNLINFFEVEFGI